MQTEFELVKFNNPVLREPIDDFDFNNPSQDPIEFAHTLAQALIIHNGLGIAANQIGIDIRAFAMMAEQIVVCFNPKIVDVSEETVKLEESCLSYPGISVKVTRPKRIKVRYTEPNGNIITKWFDGMTARIFQHELDHLNGYSMIDRCSYIQKAQVQKKLKKLASA